MDTNLSTWLANELKTRGWSIRELARRANISHTTIADVLSGQRAPTWDFCATIARTLGEQPENILRLAGLLSPLPPPVEHEQEALSLFRSLPADLRATALRLLRSLKPGDGVYRPALAEMPASYADGSDPLIGLFGELWDQAPDWKKHDIIVQLRAAVEEEQRQHAH